MAEPNRRRAPPNSTWRDGIPRIFFNDGSLHTHSRINRTPKQPFRKLDLALFPAMIKEIWIDFFRGTPAEEDDDEAIEWHARWFLDAGAYGVAGLWERQDQTGQVVDEIVVKHSAKKSSKEDSNEAFLMWLCNRGKSENVLYLRNYKSFRESNRKHDSGDCVRFYLEYAPYGSLRDLMDRYRAFHRYLLEVFLWHSFNALARAVLELEELQRPNGEEYIIHCDLKPDNILLGYEKNTYTDRTGGLLDTDEYPTLKLADFGLSLKLSPHRLAHGQRTNWAWRGTKFYETPEQDQPDPTASNREADLKAYGSDWTPPIIRSEDPPTSKMNVWSAGKVMYDLFSHSLHHHYHTEQAKTSKEYTDNEDHQIGDFEKVPFLHDKFRTDPPYSKQLSDLIESCTKARLEDRPSAREPFELTTVRLRHAAQRPEPSEPASVARRFLHYYQEDINRMEIAE